MTEYRAFRIHRENGEHRAGIESLRLADTPAGAVSIEVRYSSVNFKDALAGTGRGSILRRFPLTGGIDACGQIEESRAAGFKVGDWVLVTGYGLSTDHDGGYAEYLQAPGEWVVPLPSGLTPRDAMTLGTAGFTAALALQRMEQNGQTPDQGPVLVTGATGGVGSIAVDLLSARGYSVIAVSRRPDQDGFLHQLGAAEVRTPEQLELGQRPLEKARWAGAIDNVGGELLASLTRHIFPWGNIASIGLAGGIELHTTVMPFILRGINLLGVNSAGCPHPLRLQLWRHLADDWKPPHLQALVTEVVSLDGLPRVFDAMLAGKTRGRTLVEIE